MKAIRKKTGKKDKLYQTDELQSLTHRLVEYVQQNLRQAYIVAGVVAAAVVLTILVSMVLDKTRQTTVHTFTEALKYYDPEAPLPSNEPMGENDRIVKAREMFDEVAGESGPVADNALYYSANADMELGEMDSAIQKYQKLLARAGGNPSLTTLARNRLAEAYLAKGDREAALRSYTENSQTGFLQDESLYKAARLNEEAGRTELALEQYRKVADGFPGSPWLTSAKERIIALGGVGADASAGTEAAAGGEAKAEEPAAKK